MSAYFGEAETVMSTSISLHILFQSDINSKSKLISMSAYFGEAETVMTTSISLHIVSAITRTLVLYHNIFKKAIPFLKKNKFFLLSGKFWG